MLIEPVSELYGKFHFIPEKGVAVAQIGKGVKHSLSTPGILIEFADNKTQERHFKNQVADLRAHAQITKFRPRIFTDITQPFS